MKTSFLPNFTMGEDAITQIVNFVPLHSKIAIFYGQKAYQEAKKYVDAVLNIENYDIVAKECYGKDATYTNINRILNTEGIKECHALFAIGGGKCIDTVKQAGDTLSIPVYTIPTIASTCAAVTKISILYNDNGEFLKVAPLKQPPVHCFIEPNIIVHAPIKYLWAGIGDTMAKYIESTFSARSDRLNFTSEFGIKIGENCYYPILRDAKKALEDAKKFTISDAFSRTIQNIIITTGCVSLSVDAAYNSALSHALFYGLTTRKHIEKSHLHGEVVSYGTLVQLMMDNQKELLKKTYDLHKQIGLPVSLKNLELSIDEDLTDILDKTVVNQELEHVPYPVTKDLIYKAMKKLEEYKGE